MLQSKEYHSDASPSSEQCCSAETSSQESMLIYRDVSGQVILAVETGRGFGLRQLSILLAYKYIQLIPIPAAFAIFTPKLTSPSPLSVHKPLVLSFCSQPCLTTALFYCAHTLSSLSMSVEDVAESFNPNWLLPLM
jgi:hypothetical protein